MRTLLLVATFLAVMPPVARTDVSCDHDALSGDLWTMVRDGHVDGEIVNGSFYDLHLTIVGEVVTGHYANLRRSTVNDSIFTGRMIQDERRVLVLEQADAGYRNVLVAYEQSPNRFVGTWTDATRSQGDIVISLSE
jgi:hypothetical protein